MIKRILGFLLIITGISALTRWARPKEEPSSPESKQEVIKSLEKIVDNKDPYVIPQMARVVNKGERLLGEKIPDYQPGFIKPPSLPGKKVEKIWRSEIQKRAERLLLQLNQVEYENLGAQVHSPGFTEDHFDPSSSE